MSTSAALARGNLFFEILFVAQLGCYVCAALASLLERIGIRSHLLVFPQYFVLANLASLIALYKVIRGERYAHWEPIR